MTRIGIAALAAAALLATGCGGEADDRRGVEATVRAYFGAFAAADGERACNELSADAKAQLVETSGVEDCPAAIAKAREDPRIKRYLSDIGKVTVESVRFQGDTATAEVRGLGASTTIPLIKEGDRWKIQGVAVAASGGA